MVEAIRGTARDVTLCGIRWCLGRKADQPPQRFGLMRATRGKLELANWSVGELGNDDGRGT